MKLEIEYVKPESLLAYEGNAKRHPEEQVEQIKRSIQEFGFNDPIAVWKDNIIIEGHGRLLASLELGLDKVPIIRLDDLSDEQRKAYALVHNQLTMNSGFDLEALSNELDEIANFDMSAYGFDMADYTLEPVDEEEPADEGYYGDERERTYEEVNLTEVDPTRLAGKYQMPLLEKTDYVPTGLISFNYMLTSTEFDKGIHFCIDDYQFTRVWNRPRDYIERLREFDCMLTPDFSLYSDMPIAMQIWNVFRSRLIGQIAQDSGIVVIPTLSWSTKASYEFCFDGIPEGGTVAVSTVGVMQDEVAKKLWFQGMDEAMKRVKPTHVICYGSDIGYEFNCDVTRFPNGNAERMKK